MAFLSIISVSVEDFFKNCGKTLPVVEYRKVQILCIPNIVQRESIIKLFGLKNQTMDVNIITCRECIQIN